MLGRFKLLAALAGAAVCAALVWHHRPAPDVFNATYQGRTLEQWTSDLVRDDTPANREEVLTPIRVLCSNNLPELVAALNWDPVFERRRLGKLAPLISRLPARLRDRLTHDTLTGPRCRRFETAVVALEELGPEAEAVVPQLEKLTMNTNFSMLDQAFTVLAQLGTNGFACVLSAVEDQRCPRRRLALSALESQIRVGTNASPAALPVLVRCLQSNDPIVVRYAAMSLGDLKMQPATTIPALVAALSNPDEHARAEAINSLACFQESARAAVPALTRALGDPSPAVRTAADVALRRIAPVAAPNPGA